MYRVYIGRDNAGYNDIIRQANQAGLSSVGVGNYSVMVNGDERSTFWRDIEGQYERVGISYQQA